MQEKNSQNKVSIPLIIFGAGASHDFAQPTLSESKFPITDDLFSKTVFDQDISSKYPELTSLRARITSKIANHKKTFEDSIMEIDATYDQKVATLLYLADYFFKKSNDLSIIRTPTNYHALIDIIRKGKAKQANFITYNYDLLLERAFDPSLERFRNMDSYITTPNTIIKIHGSCDWYTLIGRSGSGVFTSLKQKQNYFDIDHDIFTDRLVKIQNSGLENFDLVPVMQIPITGDKEYSCPKAHIDTLEQRILPSTEKILIVGWKAGDPFLLKKLKGIQNEVEVCIVSGTIDDAKDVSSVVSKYVSCKKISTIAEFSKFIDSAECQEFF